MFENGISEIGMLLSTFLGEPKNGVTDSQMQFCCPCCAERKFVESDGKYNLEVNVEKGVYQCWVCGETDGMRGKISSLIKKYGNAKILKEYYDIVRNIKESSLYSLYGGSSFTDDFVDDIEEITLPYGYKPIDEKDEKSLEAYEYIKKRGLNDFFIKNYKLGYIGDDAKNPVMRNRIIIPSYNQYCDLNYWVGRYYGNDKNMIRYKNPKISKTKIIFNEKLINWYENVTLVEGVFDHMVVPNSIPLLGKMLNEDFTLYETLLRNAKANVNILLDDDAISDARRIYKFLDRDVLKNRIRVVECQDGYDASKIYEDFGVNGILDLLRKAEKIDEYDLQFIA